MTPPPAYPVPDAAPAVAAAPPPDALWPAQVPWRAVLLFTGVAVGLAWLVALPLWLGDGLRSPLFAVVATLMMWTPAAAVAVVVATTRVPHRDRWRALGVTPLRPLRRTLGLAALGLVGPVVLVVLVTLLAGAVGLVDLDLVTFSGFADQLEAALPAGAAVPPVGVVVAAQLAALPVGALLNGVVALGEEVGWRGWLLPALLPLGTWPALLGTGVVWGLWHAPLILLGYNFDRPDAGGVLLMVGGCVAWGVLLGWLRLRSASLWPPVLAHGALNAVAGVVLLLAAAGEQPDMAVVGPLGVVAWGVLGVVVLVLALTGQLGRRPSPAPGAVTPAVG